MSIAIRFTMNPKKSFFRKEHVYQEKTAACARQLAAELGYQVDVIEGHLIYQFCPEGYLWMRFKDGRLSGDCQTNIAGPGFHAAVIHFLEVFAARMDFELFVEDQTGYYQERDFKALRQNYFYPWFHDLMQNVWERRGDVKAQFVCWPAEYYIPEPRQDLVTTHIRRFSLAEIYGMAHSGLSMAFARDFFVWNEQEKDAYFYRNSALVMMNQECYFMPSSRSREDENVNREIISLLEKALSMDERIPIPKQEYLELCQLSVHPPVNVEKVQDLAAENTIGCRKGLLFRTIGCLRFAVPGHFLYDTGKLGKSERYYDGNQDSGYNYYICAVQCPEEAGFWEDSFKKDSVADVIDFCAGAARGKMAVYKPVEKQGKTVYTVSAQIVYKKQITIISIDYDDPRDKEWAVNLIKKVQIVEEAREK